MSSGQFALLTRMSRKALRLYAELGLLRPAHVDPQSGYRTYDVLQLEDARRIHLLRSTGMSLESILATLRVWHDPGLRTHLEAQRQVLEVQVEAARQSLQLIDQLLNLPTPRYQVAVRTVSPQHCLGCRGLCLPEDACTFVNDCELELRRAVNSCDLKTAGPLQAVYHEAAAEDHWDVEVCLPVEHLPEHELGQNFYAGTSPGGQSVSVVHHGDYGGTHGMQGAYTAVWTWMQEHGQSPSFGPFETYLRDASHTTEPQEFRTEIGWLVHDRQDVPSAH